MSSLERRIVTPQHPVFEGNRTPVAHGEIKQRLSFRQAVLIAAMVLSMTGWVYALGWVAFKLI
jgi:hypothetical protein